MVALLLTVDLHYHLLRPLASAMFATILMTDDNVCGHADIA